MDIKLQSKIVNQRLQLHFATLEGGWLIPRDMPFMKEFLNEVRRLCEMVESENLILNNSVVKPSERRSPTDESFSGCKPPDERQNPQEKILACTCIYRTEKGKKIAIDKCEYCKQEFLNLLKGWK